MTTPVALDYEEHDLYANEQQWLVSWHPATSEPEGQAHGAAGVCLTETGDIVLITSDGVRWDLPAGRPEARETWEQTLRREVLEEACAAVGDARLLGFSRGRCIRGREAGLTLVRSLWRAEVSLNPWAPLCETTQRKLVPARELLAHMTVEAGIYPIMQRALVEAGIM